MTSSFQKKKAEASKLWGKARERAKTEGFSGSEVEDGRYVVILQEAKMNESKNSGRLQISYTYVIQEGSAEGQTVRDHDGIEKEDSLMWTAKKLDRLGYEVPENLDDIEEVLTELTKLKPRLAVTVKTKGEFQHVYIDKVLGKGEGASEEGSVEAETPPTKAAEEEPGTVELAVGMRVSGQGKEGEVLEILETENKVRVKTDEGKVYRLDLDALEVLESEKAPEPEPEPEKDPVPEEPSARRKAVKKLPPPAKRSLPKRGKR